MRTDPELLPARANPAYSHGALSLWLASAGLLLLFVILYAVFGSLQTDVARLQGLVVTGQVLRVSEVSPEEMAALRESADSLSATEQALQGALARSQEGGAPWPTVMQRVIPVPPSEVQVTSLAQSGATLTIRGSAAGAEALTAYVGRLRGSALFSDVRIDSAAPGFAVTVVLQGYEP
jgi:Tfp pilus assembly protein PilN